MLTLALDTQIDLVDVQRLVSNNEIKKNQEKFAIAASTDGNSLLQVHVNNLGQNPVEIASLWLINKTDSNQPAKRYPITYDNTFIAPGFGSDIVASDALYIIPDDYDIKVVSYLGNTEKTTLTVDGSGGTTNNLRAELFTIPPDVIIGQNVTVAMIVTNTGDVLIQNVEPDPLSVGGTGSVIASSSHTPLSVDLDSGESVIFSWDYQVTGNSGDDLNFSAIARGDFVIPNDISSNVVSDVSILREPDGAGEEIVIRDDLFGKPKLLMIFPNALGDDETDRPIWGVNVANPTDQPIYVTKVIIVTISPRATSSDKVFSDKCEDKGSPLSPQTIFPTPDRWSCPESNQLMWKDLNNPQIIQPRSVFPFLVKIGADNMGSSLSDANNILIQPIVFSSLGQFGKAGYSSTMHSSDVALPNVYLSRIPESTSSSDILGEIRGIVSNSNVVFNATIADMDVQTLYGINSGAKLIINIPKDWTFDQIVSHTGFNTPTVLTFPDGSSQIVGTLSSNLMGNDGARTIQFKAISPTVSNTRMYVMYILGDGTATGDSPTGDDFTVGPIAETVLQVCPTTGCS